MTETAGSLTAKGRLGRAAAAGGRLHRLHRRVRDAVAAAIETEIAERRLFLWMPVAAGAGAIAYLQADREPSFVVAAALTFVFGGVAWRLRAHRAAFIILVALAAGCGGLCSAAWRTARVAAPVIDRVRIATVAGYVEEIDFRENGARFVLRVDTIDGLAAAETPYRVRLTTKRTPPFDAGAYLSVKARLLPPARAAQPGGYDFARDAWFARLGAVGNALGRIDLAAPLHPPDLSLAATMALDRGRNALARRIHAVLGGDAGAIAAAMVTGKRDYLSEEAKTTIREAGIFHIITISGVQMTLVAAIFFVGLRRLLALSPTLTLRYPIKKWAAALAIAGALFYDIGTGSRVGTERALFMTLIMLSAILLDRQALTMRNLALAALLVVLIEPEALLGASFQLSFAAVAALVAVYEGRIAAAARARGDHLDHRLPPDIARWRPRWEAFKERTRHGPGAILFATFCATTATSSFMAYNFHEFSPYVLIGNPATLTVIEFFAVPGALVGTLLYPLGLDGWVWHYVGAGISMIMAAARLVGALPGATLHLPTFAPWSLVFLALAVLSVVLWRSTPMRLTALPLALAGICGAAAGPGFDIAVPPTGDAVALRQADGQLAVLGRRPSLFAAEQWLRADADGRTGRAAVDKSTCDRDGCIGYLPDGRIVALVLQRDAFAEDCLRADILVTPLFAPQGCAAPLRFDRESLARTGAVTLRLGDDPGAMRTARSADEDRPWSPAPKRGWGRPKPSSAKRDDEAAAVETDADE